MPRPRLPDPPTPADAEDAARWTQTRLRRRLLDGTYEDDVVSRVQKHLGTVRQHITGPPDLSGCFYAALCRELATLYLEPPTVWHEAGEAASPLIGSGGLVQRSGIWAHMAQIQARTIGCRDYLIRVGRTAAGALTYRAVAPDLTIVEAPTDAPSQPYYLAEVRLRNARWYYDVFDLRDPANPAYEVREALSGKRPEEGDLVVDLTSTLPRAADGRPVLPYVAYHAEAHTDRFWDPWAWLTVVEGALNHSVQLTEWLHLFRDACWAQRYTIDCKPIGGVTQSVAGGASAVREITTDPATILELESADDKNNASAGTFAVPADPKLTLESASDYAARIAQEAGVSTSDMQRMSGDPRSGYAISLSNEGKRAAQRRFVAQFRAADERLMAVSAVVSELPGVPQDGYVVSHASIPLSPDELRARREHVFALMDRGLMGKGEAYAEMHPGVSIEQAREIVAEIAAAATPMETLNG